MITIQSGECNACGICAEICHESCIDLTGDRPLIDATVCSGCGQCIAVCPRQVLGWDGHDPMRFNRQGLPTADQLIELFRERRSIRRFRPEKVDRELLREIASAGIYAPTHASILRAIIVDDPGLIDRMDQAILSTIRWIDRVVYRTKVIAILGSLLGFRDELVRDQAKIEGALQIGHAFHSMPTAIILIVGKKKGILSNESAQYTLANSMYYAQLKGVGACLWANGPIFIDKLPGIRRQLGIARNERIYAAMYMGYPAIRFSNAVAGKTLPIQWNNSHIEE